jgi:hypothetical protein
MKKEIALLVSLLCNSIICVPSVILILDADMQPQISDQWALIAPFIVSSAVFSGISIIAHYVIAYRFDVENLERKKSKC